METTLNSMTRDDYLRAEGAQMLLRILCDEAGDENGWTFEKRNGDGSWERARYTPYQLLDAIRRYTSGVISMDMFLKSRDTLMMSPAWSRDKNGKLKIDRIDIKPKTDGRQREENRVP